MNRSIWWLWMWLDYLEYTKKFWIDTDKKLEKWEANNRFIYPHRWRHTKRYHDWLDDRLSELSDKVKTKEEFEAWLDEIAKKILEDPVWVGLIKK